MINSSELITNLTVEEFIPVIVAGISMFLIILAIFFGIGVLISWAVSKCLELDSKEKKKKEEKMKEEIYDEIMSDISLWDRLNGEDDGKGK